MQNCVQTAGQIELLLGDGDEQVQADGSPDLGLDRVRRGAEKRLDAQMLLDLFEEQFHLPALAVEFSHHWGGNVEMVGEEHQPLVPIGIVEGNPAQRLWVGGT